MARWHGCWLLVSLWLPGLVLAQEWRPASTLPAAPSGISLGKPMLARPQGELSPVGLPLPPVGPIERHVTQRPDALNTPPAINFAPAATLFQATYQAPQSAEEQFNCGVVPGPATSIPPPPPPGVAPAAGAGSPFQGLKDCWNRLWHPGAPGSSSGAFGGWDCRSDHAFDSFISPVTNPAYFEDPRSLTEIRPIFIYQKAPSDNPLMQGGNIFALNLQARVSINDHWSFVLNRLGLARVNPGDGALNGFSGGTGLTDLGVGTKYTFIRDDRSNTLLAAGINFDVPIGNSSVLSGNGAGAEPYLSYGQGFGNWHLLATTGYRFGLSSTSSDFLFLSGHLDYGFFNRLYPLVEVNWYHYTSGGNQLVADFEGADLFNLGSTDVGGHNIVTVGLGLRYKFTEGFQTGLVFEFPVIGTKDLERYRVGFDLIFRF
jgi:hypothetical protein